jgi:SulP family sulfate permease
MSRIPLSALAGILIMTAWRMNEWEHITEYFHGRYKTSMAQFLVTMGATVMFDLTMAILLGIGLSMVIFVITSSNLDISVANIDERHEKGRNLCEHLTKVKLMYVTGQLFFGSQDKLVASIENLGSVSTVILSIRGVPSIDHSAMSALHEIHDLLVAREARLVFCGLQPRVHRQFERSGFDKKIGKGNIFNNAVEAIDSLDFLH